MVKDVISSSFVSPLQWGFLHDILPPWTEVEGGDVLTSGEIGAGLELKRLLRNFGDASVVADDAGKRCFPQGIPLLLGEDSIVLPPESEFDMNIKLCSYR